MKLHTGHVLDVLKTLPEGSVQCVVTSPPYWGLRKYAGEQEVVWGGKEGCEHEWGIEIIKDGMSGGKNSEKVQIKGQENFGSVPLAVGVPLGCPEFGWWCR